MGGIVRDQAFFILSSYMFWEPTHWTRQSVSPGPSPNDPVVDDNTDDWLDRTMGFAVILMNSTIPWIGWLGIPHHTDDQVPILGGSQHGIQSVQPITKLEMNMTCQP